MQKILVTGGAGYIGSHCAMALLKKNYDVIICDNLSTGHIETIDKLKAYGSVDFYKIDLLNEKEISEVFNKNKIDAVLHFAAFSQVAESEKNPQKYYINNVCGSLNLLKTMLENDVKKIVFSSTAAIYGEPLYTPIDEAHPLNPINPYGETKLFIEKLLNNYDKIYNMRSVCLRYFNVIGADNDGLIGEWHVNETHLIPKILQSILSNEGVFEMYGTDYDTFDGTCIRDYIDIEDLVSAHIKALEYLFDNNNSTVINLGTNNGNSVKEIVNLCEKITNKKINIRLLQKRAGDVKCLVADNKKAKEILNWMPQKPLEQSIISAYKWEKIKQDK